MWGMWGCGACQWGRQDARQRPRSHLTNTLLHLPGRPHPPSSHSYTGRWFQVYADLETSLFESRFCVVTDYGLFANGTISVRNRQRDGSVNGAYSGILGWAGLNNRTGLGTADGSLSVYLQIPPPGPQGIAAPYDIILLGPKTYGPYGLYECVGRAGRGAGRGQESRPSRF